MGLFDFLIGKSECRFCDNWYYKEAYTQIWCPDCWEFKKINDECNKLCEARFNKIITQEEFIEVKNKILGRKWKKEREKDEEKRKRMLKLLKKYKRGAGK